MIATSYAERSIGGSFMKIAFTTLGCPKWDLGKIISSAVEHGYDGVDFRGYMGELDIFKFPEFSSDLKQTARRISDAGLELSCFASSARVFSKTDEEAAGHLDEVRSYAEICGHFQTHFIRVFGGGIGDVPREQAIDIAAGNLARMAGVAEDNGVCVVLETHDDWLCCDHLKPIVEQVDSPAVGILWDVHHPYRMIDEQPSKTWDTLGKWIKYTHVKDSYTKEGSGRSYQLCLTGEGDIPLGEIVKVMKDGGYDGYLTLEWEKMWVPEIEEPEVAFPCYSKVIREICASLGA
jgi:sugar phosphate isomerase/epimerase